MRSTVLVFLIVPLTLLMFLGAAQPAIAQVEQVEKALEAMRPQADDKTICRMLQSISMMHLQAGNSDKAAERIDESLQLCRKNKLTIELRATLTIASQILNKLDRDKSNAFLAGFLKAGDAPELDAIVMDVLGRNLMTGGRVVLAMTVFHDYQQRVEKQSPDTIEEAKALLNYGQACVIGKLPELGLPALKKGFKIAQRKNDDNLLMLFGVQISSAAINAKEYKFAEQFVQQQLAELKTKPNPIPTAVDSALTNLAIVFLHTGQFDKARSTLQQLEQNGSSEYMKSTAICYSAILDMAAGKPADAATRQTAGMDRKLKVYPDSIRQQMGDELLMHDNLALAAYHISAGNLDKASSVLDKAERGSTASTKRRELAVQVGGISSDESNLIAADTEASISGMRQQVLVAQKKYGEALLAAENGRARAQRLLMQARLGISPDQIAKRNAITLESLVQIARDQKTTIIEYSLVRRLDRISRSMLGEKHPLCQPHALYIWAIKPSGKISFRSMDLKKSIAGLVDAARNLVRAETKPPQKTADGESVSGPTAGQLLHVLHQLLIDPIAEHLPQDPEARVTMIPHGELFLVPFAALTDEKGSPLIERHTLLTSPSIEVIRLAAEQQKRGRGIKGRTRLVVGNPTMPTVLYRPDKPPAPLDPLKGAEAEAKLIGQMLKVEPLVGDAATESAVVKQMESAAVIHFATHGLLEAQDAISQSYLSSIALAADDNEDGFLTVRETMNMKLNAELAVLSACDSGRGRISGDGVLGLSRAYIAAGVPSVAVSLWPVSDQATAVLMTTYYENLLSGSDKAAALRKAMLATRNKFPQPGLWAPFTLYGVGG